MSLVAWYPLNGNTNDYSGNGYNAIPKLKYRWYNTLNAYNTIGGHATNSTNMTYFFDTGYSSLGGEGYFTSSRISFGSTPNGTTIVDNLPSYITSVDHYSVELFGYINIPEDGIYTFGMDSDDSCELMIDNNIVISFYGGRGFTGNFNVGATSLTLTKGYHKFKARFVEGGGGDGMAVAWKKPGDIEWSFIPIQQFNVTGSILSGKIGKAALFNGVDTTIQLPAVAIPSTSVISFCVWNYGISAKYSSIIEARSANDMRTLNIHLPWSDNTVYFDCGNNGTVYDRISKIATNEEYQGWHHWVFIKDCFSGIMKIYRDGLLWHSGTGLYLTLPETTTVAIGTNNLGNSNFHYGYLNDIRIYDHALSEKEIKEIAKAKILHYSFDDFQEPTQNAWNALSTTGSNGSWSVIDNPFTNQPFISESKIIKCTPRSYMNYYTWNNTDGTKYPFGTKFTVSCWCYVDPIQDNMGSYRICGEGKTNASVSYDKTKAGTWQFLKFTVTSTDVGFYFLLYANEGLGEKTWTTGNVYYANVQIEAKTYNTPYTNSARSGTISDQSGFRNNATLALATTPQWIGDSKIGSGAYKFNGIDKYIDVNILKDFPYNTGITFSMWTYPTEVKNWARFFDAGVGQQNDNIVFTRQSTTNKIYLEVKNGTSSGTYVAGGELSLNTWQHVAFTISSSGGAKIYLNGISVGSGTVVIPNLVSRINTFIARSNWSADAYYAGFYDDVRIYATALSDTDILELYKTRASIDNVGNVYSTQFVENIEPTINYSTNSNIETGTTTGYSQPGSGSTGTTIAIDSSVKYSGNYSLKLSRTGDTSQSNTSHYYGVQQSNSFGSVSGKTLIFSAKAKANRSGINFRIQMQRAGGNWQGFASSLYTSTGDWQTIYVTGTFDTSDSLTCYSRIYFNDHTTSGNGDSIYIDEWQMENKNYFTPFITGTRPQSESLPSTFIYKEAIQENGIVQADSISEVGITEGLTLYYPFDKDSNDYSGNNYHGTSYNISLSSGIKGQAYNFNGTTGYVASTFTFPNSYSIGCWFKHNGWGFNYENHLVASNTGWDTGGYRLYYGTTGVYFAIYDQQTTFYTGDHLDGNWHHLLVTFSQGTFNLFFDGILVNTKPSITRVISTSAMSIGRLYVTSSDIRYHKGSIDEVRIYNRALSAEEVAILYETTSPTSSSVKITKDTIYMRSEIKEVY